MSLREPVDGPGQPSRRLSVGRLCVVASLTVAVVGCTAQNRQAGVAPSVAAGQQGLSDVSGVILPPATSPTKLDPKLGVAASPVVVANAERVPSDLGRGAGRYMVGKPYNVGGKRYVPREDPNYVAMGKASWYGTGFHGRKTANGEVFDMNDITAAHPTMPLPSYARITNMKNGSSIVVRVNDRGPFHGGRVLDVSRRTAELLRFKQAGVGQVKVEYLGPAQPFGSDEKTLLATLRMDGQPAPRPGAAPVMVASAGAAQGGAVTTPVRVASVRPVTIQPGAPVSASAFSETPMPPRRPAAAGNQTPFAATPAAAPTVLPEETPAQAGSDKSASLVPLSPMQLNVADIVGQRTTSGLAFASLGDDAPISVAAPRLFVSGGVFADRARAVAVMEALAAAGNVEMTAVRQGSALRWQVRAGPFESDAQARQALARARTVGAGNAEIVTP